MTHFEYLFRILCELLKVFNQFEEANIDKFIFIQVEIISMRFCLWVLEDYIGDLRVKVVMIEGHNLATDANVAKSYIELIVHAVLFEGFSNQVQFEVRTKDIVGQQDELLFSV